jgi:hypothetical protein
MKNNLSDKTIFVDVDGVLFDLIGKVLPEVNRLYSKEISEKLNKTILLKEDLTDFHFLERINHKTLILFEDEDLYNIKGNKNKVDIDLIDGAKELMIFLKSNFKVVKILTHSFNKKVEISKNNALRFYFNLSEEDIIHEENKHIYINENDYFVDDGLHNHNSVFKNVKNVNHFVVKQPWNLKEQILNPEFFHGNLIEIMEELKKKLSKN